MPHIRESRPDAGLGLKAHVLKTFQVVPCALALCLSRYQQVQRRPAAPPASGDTTPCRMTGTTPHRMTGATPCRMTGVTLHGVASPEGAGRETSQMAPQARILSGRGFMINTRAQRKALHTWIISVIVKQYLVRTGRIDGRTEYLPETLAAINLRVKLATRFYGSRC